MKHREALNLAVDNGAVSCVRTSVVNIYGEALYHLAGLDAFIFGLGNTGGESLMEVFTDLVE